LSNRSETGRQKIKEKEKRNKEKKRKRNFCKEPLAQTVDARSNKKGPKFQHQKT
jgi:hypothetical protein